MRYEDLFTDRVKVGSNIGAIMRDRKCTKVQLSKEIKVSRPTLDAILRGDIHNTSKYSEYMRRVLAYFQISATILYNYQSLPKLERQHVVSIHKETVKKTIEGLEIPVFTRKDGDFEKLKSMVKKAVSKGVTAYAISYVRGVEKLIAELVREYPEHVIGVANIIDKNTAGISVDCGAKFIMTPGVSDEIIAFCKARDMLLLSGVLTASDIIRVAFGGGDVTCLYPYEEIDISIMRALKLIDCDIKYCCMKSSGKIDPKNVEDAFALLYYVEK